MVRPDVLTCQIIFEDNILNLFYYCQAVYKCLGTVLFLLDQQKESKEQPTSEQVTNVSIALYYTYKSTKIIHLKLKFLSIP